jgi:hypothetical protein
MVAADRAGSAAGEKIKIHPDLGCDQGVCHVRYCVPYRCHDTFVGMLIFMSVGVWGCYGGKVVLVVGVMVKLA